MYLGLRLRLGLMGFKLGLTGSGLGGSGFRVECSGFIKMFSSCSEGFVYVFLP